MANWMDSRHTEGIIELDAAIRGWDADDAISADEDLLRRAGMNRDVVLEGDFDVPELRAWMDAARLDEREEE